MLHCSKGLIPFTNTIASDKLGKQVLNYRRIYLSKVVLDRDPKRISGRKIKELLENARVEETLEPKSPESDWLSSPYRELKKRSQSSHAFRLPGNPSDSSIVLFPGQGTQYVGMAKNAFQIDTVREMFKVASKILKWDLAKLCFEGPKSELDRTSKAQPAILVASLAALEMMRMNERKSLDNCIATAGFSVGEYAALVFSGVMSFDDAVHVVKARGEAMESACSLVPSGMMTVIMDCTSKLGIACHEAVRWCADKGVERPVCTVANYLYPHCKVVGGHNEALSFIEQNAKTYNLRRCKRLPVSGAFHTKLMQPAIQPLREVLNLVELNSPLIPVHSNIDGKRYTSPYHISRLLCKQIVSPVKWEQTLHVLTEYQKDSTIPKIYECGPGTSLSTILRMVNNKAVCHSYEA